MVPIDELNSLEKDSFLKVVNELFETAPVLADKLWISKPFESYGKLIDLVDGWIKSGEFSHEDLVEIINAHPRIGAPKQSLSAHSYAEQGYSKQTSTEDEIVNEQLQILNNQYESMFGFKFVVFVAGRPRKEIIKVMESRLANGTSASELELGLSEMMMIARDRAKKFA